MNEVTLIASTPDKHPLIGQFVVSGTDIVEVVGIGVGGRQFEHYAQIKYPHGLVWVLLEWVLAWDRPANNGVHATAPAAKVTTDEARGA